MSNKALTAILIVADDRERGQAVLDSLYAQTIADRIEIIIYDMGHRDPPSLRLSEHIPTDYVVVSGKESWAKIRAEGVRRARAPVVAFLEDHCVAENQWADALVQAHRGPWACVGYAFTNPTPDVYLARAIFFAEYGRWMHPAIGGPASILPCGNVAYKRDLLLSLGDELETLLTPDFSLHERFRQMGLPLYVEANARISHASMARVWDMLDAAFVFCRILAAHRAQTQSWSRWKRFGYAVATPVASPLFAILRLTASMRHRRSLWVDTLTSVPIILFRGISAALGESIGYVFGTGASAIQLSNVELYKERVAPR